MSRAREGASMFSLRPGGDFNHPQKPSESVHVWGWLASAVLLVAIFVGCATFYVWLYVQQVQNGYRLSKFYEQNELLGTVQRKLTLEWSRFREPQRLQEIGTHFGLAPPRPDQKIIMP